MDQRPTPDGLETWWDKRVSEFATLEPDDLELTEWERQRHRIFSLLLCSIIFGKWNGNKNGPLGDYGMWREGQILCRDVNFDRSHNSDPTLLPSQPGNVYCGDTYEGHNICALAVDGEGRIIDFEFNHNALFDSTVEHAESRLVRRLFALNQVYTPWYVLGEDTSVAALQRDREHQHRSVFATASSDRPAPQGPSHGTDTPDDPDKHVRPYTSLLKDVTIYTSLESCAQCSGIMCLASVKDIVYLQWDQGQFQIGNIMRNATRAQQQPGGFLAPRPIRGDQFDFEYFTDLNEKCNVFLKEVTTKPFWLSPDGARQDSGQSVTSFLCTDDAKNIFKQAADELEKFEITQDHRPPDNYLGLSNRQVLEEARDFQKWVTDLANRGAPHRV